MRAERAARRLELSPERVRCCVASARTAHQDHVAGSLLH